jgi:hypothetical protein
MTDFWLSQSATRIRIHRGECGACDWGRALAYSSGKAPFSTYADAAQNEVASRDQKHADQLCVVSSTVLAQGLGQATSVS